METDERALFFVGDHILCRDWFLEDREVGHLYGLGSLFAPEEAARTSRRIRRFAQEVPMVLLPTHGAEAPARLAAMEPVFA